MTTTFDYLRTEDAGPVHVRFVCYSLNRAPEESAEVVLTIDQVLDLVRNLLAGVHVDSIVREHFAGNCVRCQNTRSIVVPNAHGRDERVRCPVCRDAMLDAPMPLHPYGRVR